MSLKDWHIFTSSLVISDSAITESEYGCSLFVIFSIKTNFAGEAETVFPITFVSAMVNRTKNNIFFKDFISLQR